MKKMGMTLWLALTFISSIITLSQAENLKPNQAFKDSRPTKLERKSPSGALFRSLFVPGWGQWYNKKHLKSTVVFLGEGTLIGFAAYEWSQVKKHKDNFQKETDPYLRDLEFQRFELHQDNRNTYLWFLAGAAFISMWDAYVDAHLFNFRQQTKELDLMGGLDREGRVRVGVRYNF